MISSHKAKFFKVQELVSEDVYNERGNRAWQMLDIRAVANLDALRAQLGVPVTVNNWDVGGARTQSGLRIPGMKHYKAYSQHSFGRAFDLVCEIPAPEIRHRLREGDIRLPHPACFEDFKGMSWVHMDVRNMSNDHVYFFKL